MLALVSLRVRVKNLVTGEHVTLQGGLLGCDKVAMIAVEEMVEGGVSGPLVLVHARLRKWVEIRRKI